MKFLTRLSILMVVLGIIYLWMKMAPRMQMVTVQTGNQEELRRTSITVDSFLHVQQLRKKQLRHFCSWFPQRHSMNVSGSVDHLLSGMTVSHKLMTLYCKPDDVAIDGWEELLLAMERFNFRLKNPLPVDNSDNQLPKYKSEMLTHLLPTYTKVLFVGNPFERLISLYIQGDAGEITFQEFIEDILLEETRVDGISSRSVLILCQPCLVQYDYIVMLDFLEAELRHLLRRIGLPEWVKLPSIDQDIKLATRWLSRRLFRGLPKEQLRQLTKLYSWDFAAFPLRSSLVGNRTMAKSVTRS